MEEMNGMKEKFDIALSRIGEQIEKDQQEQDEMQLSKSLISPSAELVNR